MLSSIGQVTNHMAEPYFPKMVTMSFLSYALPMMILDVGHSSFYLAVLGLEPRALLLPQPYYVIFEPRLLDNDIVSRCFLWDICSWNIY
jgi:hypothetical protein